MILQNKHSAMAPAIVDPARAKGTASFAIALDVDNFKTWTYATATAGVTRVYGAGGTPLEHRTFTFIPARDGVRPRDARQPLERGVEPVVDHRQRDAGVARGGAAPRVRGGMAALKGPPYVRRATAVRAMP